MHRTTSHHHHSTTLTAGILLHSPSRPSSSASNRSNRARSPSLSLDDPGHHHFLYRALSSLTPIQTVSVRHHMSALKHNIRHQQAQLQNLETILQRTPRLPLSAASTASPSSSPPPDLSPSDLPPTTPNGKSKRLSSFDVLQSLAGPDSNLPLPRRDPGSLSQDGIREGVPMDFGAGPSSQSYKRQSSPTRTLSRACRFRFHFPRTSLTLPHSRHTRFLRRFVYNTSPSLLYRLPSTCRL
jgi:hypothetical protein